MRRLVLVSMLAGLAGPSLAHAASPEACAPDAAPDKYRMLRQVTLDLWGRIPTYDEYRALDDQAELTGAAIDAMFTSEEYFAQLRSYFRHLIWGGLPDDFGVTGSQRRMTRQATTNLYFVGNLRSTFRGRADVTCLDQAQTSFDADGRPVPISTFVDPTCSGATHTCKQEGYVMVTPYWSATPLKVCAYDAQALAVGVGAGSPTCTPYTIDAGCGCGPNLRNCTPGIGDANHTAIRDALAEESTRIFDAVVRSGRSYFDTFTTRETYVNGPLVQFYKNLAGADIKIEQGGAVGYDPLMPAALPTLAFGDVDTWVPVTRPEGHAGVLTTAGFQLRLGSNRGRVNRWYSAFRCEPFVPPAGGLPADTGGEPDPNLRTRNGCAGCHNTIEPAAAHFARWRTQGQFGFFPPTVVNASGPHAGCSTGCTSGACKSFCDAYFITTRNSTAQQQADYMSWPQASLYLDAAETAAIDRGPAGLVDDADEQAKVASCAVRTLSEQLLGRDLTPDETLKWLPEATATFAASGYKFTSLYRALLDLPQYRQTR
ncbi:MAG: hypothetical protein R3B06_24940 [Kofleriaceae bacterium]